MAINITVDIGQDSAKKIADDIREMTRLFVLVGIAEKDDARPMDLYGEWVNMTRGSNIGNAALGYIHEHGSPINNIPPRPWLVPGVRQSSASWVPYLESAAAMALLGAGEFVIRKELEKAGFKAVEGVTRRIKQRIPPPLAKSTVRARRNRGTGSSYRRKAMNPGDTTPLIDTGELIKHISFVVEKDRITAGSSRTIPPPPPGITAGPPQASDAGSARPAPTHGGMAGNTGPSRAGQLKPSPIIRTV